MPAGRGSMAAMASRLPLVTASAACLVLGFGAGWWWQQRPATAPAASSPAPAASAPVAGAAALAPDVVAARLATLQWLQAAGMPVQLPPVSPFTDTTLNPIFVKAFALDGAEEAKLRLALIDSRRRYDEVLTRTAQGRIDEAGKELTVKIAPSPEAGGRIHDDLLDTFRNVLGPERFALFNQLSAEAFAGTYDSFGMGQVTLTMKLTPRHVPNGPDTYQIVRAVTSASGQRTLGTSQIDLATARRSFPVLFRFLPADFGSEPTAK